MRRSAVLAALVTFPFATLFAQQPTPAALDTPIVRGLYVNRWASQSAKRMPQLIAMCDRTEANALVIDMKDEFGLNYQSANPLFARNGGNAGQLRNLKALLDTLKAHKILSIARIVVFKDSVTARVNPSWTIRKQDGTIWRDHKGLAWVNPHHKELWAYNIGVAEELVKLGFREIQFDYIRFPEPYKSLPAQIFPGADSTPKPHVIGNFLKEARARINPLGARVTADVFGLVTTIPGALEVAQQWETLASATDVLLPMVYPSHYPRGAFGVPHPNAEPYKIIYAAIKRATSATTSSASWARPPCGRGSRRSRWASRRTAPRRSRSSCAPSTTRATRGGCSGARAAGTNRSWRPWAPRPPRRRSSPDRL